MRALAKLEAGPGHVGIVRRPDPSPAPGQVLVDVHGAGVCGTDLHIEDGEYPMTPPVTMGHEVSGVVAEVGAGVDAGWRGRRVVAETYYATCETCALCRAGRRNLCAARRSIGSHADGGFAARLVLPEVNLHAVPDGVDAHAAALAEPLACVCNCLLDPPVIQPGDRVLVVGPGAIGLLAAQVARAQGASVLVAGLPRDADRLEAAANLGFEVTDGRPAAGSSDVVVECSGSAGGAALCLEAVRRAGRYVQVGVFGGEVTVPLDRLVYGELVITSGFASTPRSWTHAMRLIGAGTVDLGALVSGVAPLDAWKDVFADLRAGRGLKTVLDPRL